jgi:DNA polymerase-3 subunit epsilon
MRSPISGWTVSVPRQVLLDTETTGLHAQLGDRVVEIGCIELLSRRVTDNRFHRYVNPERKSEEGAARVHGIADEFLAAQPKFADIAREFVEFVRGAELIVHNAGFDVEFLDLELGRAGLGRLADHVAGVVDTLALARELHPGKKNSLDALCERYAVDNAHRTLHGALLDARLLAEVYLAMTRGQDSLVMDLETPAEQAATAAAIDASQLAVLCASAAELQAHEEYLERMAKEAGGKIVWRRA